MANAALEIVGWLGVAVIVMAYLTHSFGWLANGRLYHCLNLLGAIAIASVSLR